MTGLNFGIECEVASGSADILRHLGLDGLHSYHCHCSQCSPTRSGPDWTAQEDCTSDGEFISRILTYRTHEADDAIDRLADALRLARATHTDGSDHHGVNGLHVHVDSSGLDRTGWVHFWRLWFRYEDDIARLAQGRYDDVREYNAPPDRNSVFAGYKVVRKADRWGGEYDHHENCPAKWEDFWSKPADEVVVTDPYGRGWVNTRTGHGTVEFRLWNATRLGWRIHLAAGISTALVAAAMAGVNVTEHDERTLFDIVHPFLSEPSTAAIVRAYTWEQ